MYLTKCNLLIVNNKSLLTSFRHHFSDNPLFSQVIINQIVINNIRVFYELLFNRYLLFKTQFGLQNSYVKKLQ